MIMTMSDLQIKLIPTGLMHLFEFSGLVKHNQHTFYLFLNKHMSQFV